MTRVFLPDLKNTPLWVSLWPQTPEMQQSKRHQLRSQPLGGAAGRGRRGERGFRLSQFQRRVDRLPTRARPAQPKPGSHPTGPGLMLWGLLEEKSAACHCVSSQCLSLTAIVCFIFSVTWVFKYPTAMPLSGLPFFAIFLLIILRGYRLELKCYSGAST